MDFSRPHHEQEEMEAAEGDEMQFSDIVLSYDYETSTDQPQSFRQRLLKLSESVRNFGFVVAIFVVFLGQFQGPIMRWLRRLRREKVSFADAVLHLWWITADYVRGCWQMCKETLRTATAIVSSDATLVPTRSREQAQLSARHCRSSTLPELEIEQARHTEKSMMAQTPWYQTELEPAFLNEKDYPPGWMVYHPVLGVEAKAVADQHDRHQLVMARAEQKTYVEETRRCKATSAIDHDSYEIDSGGASEAQSIPTSADVQVHRSIAAS